MSDTGVLERQKSGLDVRRPVVIGRRARSTFYIWMSAALLLIVLVGFARTLYLRPLFDVPPVSVSLLVHGVVLTAWFVFVLVQSALVATRRTNVHRRLGWTGVGLGATAFVLSAAEVVMFVSRTYAGNPSGIPGAVRIFWANSAALTSFAVFVSIAVARRRQPEVHRRLMLLAAITLVQPAMARIRQVWFPEMDGAVFAIVWLSLLVGAIAVHDLQVTRSVHRVTVFAGLFFLGSRLFAQYVVAPSQFGAAFVRRVVEYLT